MRTISVTEGGTHKVWDLASGKEVATFIEDIAIGCCAISPDCKSNVLEESFGRVNILRFEGVD